MVTTTREEVRPEILARLAAAANLGHALEDFAATGGSHAEHEAEELANACAAFLLAQEAVAYASRMRGEP